MSVAFTTPLASVDDVRGYLDIAGSVDDDLIDRLCASATSLMNQVMNRDVMLQQYSESYDGTGSVRQVMRQWPIVSVASVTVNDALLTPATTVMGAGYRFDTYSIFRNAGLVFSRGIQNVLTVYRAGYVNIPADLNQACVDIVADMYRRRNRVGEASKSIGGGTSSYSMRDLPESAKLTLQNYERQAPI